MADQCVLLDLSPACVNLTGIRSGDRNEVLISITSAGDPYDLTGQTVAAQARFAAEDIEPVLNGVVTVLDGPAGQISLRWPGDDVATWLGTEAKAKGVWDLETRPVSGDPITLLAGSFSARLDVTRAVA